MHRNDGDFIAVWPGQVLTVQFLRQQRASDNGWSDPGNSDGSDPDDDDQDEEPTGADDPSPTGRGTGDDNGPRSSSERSRSPAAVRIGMPCQAGKAPVALVVTGWCCGLLFSSLGAFPRQGQSSSLFTTSHDGPSVPRDTGDDGGCCQASVHVPLGGAATLVPTPCRVRAPPPAELLETIGPTLLEACSLENRNKAMWHAWTLLGVLQEHHADCHRVRVALPPDKRHTISLAAAYLAGSLMFPKSLSRSDGPLMMSCLCSTHRGHLTAIPCHVQISTLPRVGPLLSSDPM